MTDPTDASCHISTCGDFLHRFVPLLDVVSDEHRLNITEDGLTVSTVDPANVMMADIEVDADGLSDYVVEQDHEIAFETSRFNSVLGYVRKGRGDDIGDIVTIDVDRNNDLNVGISRDESNRRRVIPTPSSNSVRQAADPPELDFEWRCHVNADEFKDGINALDADHDHVQFSIFNTDDTGVDDRTVGDMALYSSSETDIGKDLEDEISFDNAAEAESGTGTHPRSMYSIDFLTDMADALASVTDGAKILFKFGDEFPLITNVEIPDYGLRATYCLAPRITDDNGLKHPSWGEYP